MTAEDSGGGDSGGCTGAAWWPRPVSPGLGCLCDRTADFPLVEQI